MTRTVKKEDLNKDRKFFCRPNDKETSCRYFEWVPEKQNHMFYQSVSFFTKPRLEKSSSEKNMRAMIKHINGSVFRVPIRIYEFLTKEFINDFAYNLNI